MWMCICLWKNASTCRHMLVIGDLEVCYFMHLWVVHKFKFLHRQESTSFGLLFILFLWPAGTAMKTVVGQTEYLYSLMKMAQTRPPTLKFSPVLCFLSPLHSKDLCCFEAKGMRKCCLPSYRSIVFASTWQMVQCPTLSWLERKMLPNSCCNIFLQYWSHCLFSATGSYRPCVVLFLSQFIIKVRSTSHWPRSGKGELECSHLCFLLHLRNCIRLSSKRTEADGSCRSYDEHEWPLWLRTRFCSPIASNSGCLWENIKSKHTVLHVLCWFLSNTVSQPPATCWKEKVLYWPPSSAQ